MKKTAELIVSVMLILLSFALLPLRARAAAVQEPDGHYVAENYFDAEGAGSNQHLTMISMFLDRENHVYLVCRLKTGAQIKEYHTITIAAEENGEGTVYSRNQFIQHNHKNSLSVMMEDGTAVTVKDSKYGYVVFEIPAADVIGRAIFLNALTTGNGWNLGGPDERIRIDIRESCAIDKVIEEPKAVYADGDEVVYRITVTNTGNTAVRDIDVFDELPAGLSMRSVNGIQTETTGEDRLLLGHIDVLPVGESAVFRAAASVTCTGLPFDTQTVRNRAYYVVGGTYQSEKASADLATDPYFTVIHFDGETKEILSSETIRASASGDSGCRNADGTFDLTKGTAEGYLWGGLYEEDMVTPVRSACGLSVSPACGDVYYCKNVSDGYLRSRVPYFYTAKDTQFAYLVTILDGLDYLCAGFDIEGMDSVKTDICEDTVYSSVTSVTKYYEEERAVSYFADSAKPVGSGYLMCFDLKDVLEDLKENRKTVTLIPYYVTPDHVRVTGVVKKTVTFAPDALPKGENTGIPTETTAYSGDAPLLSAPRMVLAAPFRMMTYRDTDIPAVPDVQDKDDMTQIHDASMKLYGLVKGSAKAAKRITFLFAVTPDACREVGFTVTVNGRKTTYTTSRVQKYNGISADKLETGRSSTDRITFLTLDRAAYSTEDEITVCGYIVKKDGTTVYGEEKHLTVRGTGFTVFD